MEIDHETGCLITASDYGDCKTAEECLKNGANPNGMPLIMAIQCGNLCVVEVLVKYGAEINLQYKNTTPLIRAISSGYFDIAAYLIQEGASLTQKDKQGYLPIDWIEKTDLEKGKEFDKISLKELIKGFEV